MTHGLPLLLSLEAPTAATSCSSRYVFMRPQTGQEKSGSCASCCSLGKSSFPHPASRNKQNKWDPQHLPEADVLTSLAGARGAGEGGQRDGYGSAGHRSPFPYLSLNCWWQCSLQKPRPSRAPSHTCLRPQVSQWHRPSAAGSVGCSGTSGAQRGAAVRHKEGQQAQETFASPTETPDSICWMVVPTPQAPPRCPYPEPW